MKNKYLTIFLLVLLMILPSIFPDNESRYEEWSKSLLCPVCQGETIYDSPSEYADDMGVILLEQINNKSYKSKFRNTNNPISFSINFYFVICKEIIC